MPTDGSTKAKNKRLAMLRRGRSAYSDVDQQRDDLDQEGLLPPKLRYSSCMRFWLTFSMVAMLACRLESGNVVVIVVVVVVVVVALVMLLLYCC